MSMLQPLFSPRLTKLLLELLKKDDYISTTVLAKAINTSKRTLFREISGCNSILKKYDLRMDSKTGLGIRVTGSKEDKVVLFTLLKSLDSNSGYYDVDQRRMLLTAELLKNKTISKLVTYAQLFDVSEATISNDLSVLDQWFEKFRLALIRKPGYGIELVGSEDDVRKAMTNFVHDQLKENKLIDLIYLYQDDFDIREYFNQLDNSSILNLLNHEILSKVIQVIRDSEFKYVQKMADSSLIGLIIHLTIAIERLIARETINMDNDLLMKLKNDDDYPNAKSLAKYMENAFMIDFPDDEIAYILMHLKGSKLKSYHSDSNDHQSVDNMRLKTYITKMIQEFENKMKVQLVNDEILHKGLLTHLRPTLTRMDYKLSIRNPLLEQIQKQYSEVFLASKVAVKVLEKSIDESIPIDEVGYIALHFGAALERYHKKMNETTALRIGVVCASGIGISSLLSSRLKNIFPDIYMIVPMAMEDVIPSIGNQLDLLITTIPLEKSPIASVYVQPLLGDVDIEKITAAIATCKLKKSENIYLPTLKKSIDPLKELASINLMIQKLTKQIEIVSLNHTLSYAELIEKVSMSGALNQKQAREIQTAIINREKYGYVLVDDVKLILLHAKLHGIGDPILKFFLSDRSHFIYYGKQPYSTIMLMIADKESDLDTNKMLSMISSGLIDDDNLKEAIQAKNEENIKQTLTVLLQKWYRAETMNRLTNI